MAERECTLGTLFIVDDEEPSRLTLTSMLTARGYSAKGFASGAEALEALQTERPDLLLADLTMPCMDGVALVKAVIKLDPAPVCLLMAGQESAREAVDAMRAGAFDYILKPFNLGALLPVLERAMAVHIMRQENAGLKAAVSMRELGAAISSSLDEQEIWDKLVAAALEQCGADEANLLLPGPGSDSVRIVAAAGEGAQARIGQIKKVADGVEGWKARHQAPVVHGHEEHDISLHPGLIRSGPQASACLPIAAGGSLIGVLAVSAWGSERSLPQDQFGALQVLCGMAGAAAGNARLLRKVQESEEKYRTISESIPDLVALTDPEGTYLWVNPAYKKVLGYGPQALLKGIVSSLIHPEDIASIAAFWERLRRGEGGSAQYRVRHADGRFIVLEGAGAPIHSVDGKPVGAVVVSRDVTGRKAIEEQLERAKNLETIGMIASGVAHEVRNPLHAINIMATVLKKKLGDSSGYDEHLGHIQDQVERLSLLMSDLLLLGRPQDPALCAPCDLEMAAREAVSLACHQTSGAAGLFDVQASGGPFVVSGVQGKLVQVFVNLFSNALSSSPEGELVRVRMAAQEGSVTVTITDLGPGIPEKLLPDIFTPFKSQRKWGTGLGLAIAQKILADHGGAIAAANNDPGPGASFTVRLPMTSPCTEDVAGASAPAATGGTSLQPSRSMDKASAVIDISSLDPGLVARLRHATTEANYDRILELIEQIRLSQPLVAANLSSLAEDFEYQKLLDTLGPEGVA